MHPEYTIQKLNTNGTWQLLSLVYITPSLDAARMDCDRVQRANPRNKYRIAVRLAGEWCELQQEK